VALCVAYGALQRTESRGAHFRQDYPQRDDAQWLSRTLATWKDLAASLPELDYEDLNVMQMEMPPGWRGYGAKDHIAHPETSQREAEVERIRNEMSSDHRTEVQQVLMPYQHLLPGVFQCRNMRFGEEE